MQADDIRKFAYEHFIAPAIQRGEKTITIRVGDVRKAMGHIDNAAIAGALGAEVFQNDYHAKRIKAEGPIREVILPIRLSYSDIQLVFVKHENNYESIFGL